MIDDAANLPLRQRPFDVFFIVAFSWFIVSSVISDAIPTLGIEMTEHSSNVLARWNWAYAHDTDPLFLDPPVWMRFVTGLSAFVYGPFYVVLVLALVKGWNRIQLPAVMYATMIATITGVIVFGVEFFGEEQYRTPRPGKFVAFNLPYVLIPLLLLVRMRRERPFARRF